MIIVLNILFLATCLTSYVHSITIPEKLKGVKEIVMQLDSAVTAMSGAESEDPSCESFAKARDNWAVFTKLIEEDKYESALNFYQDGRMGDFLIHLKHSRQRYSFFSQVLRPLMQVYKGDDDALKQYIENLQLEKAMEDLSIDLQADGNGYIPDVYPFVIRDLGYSLAITGKMIEAQELFKDLIDAVYGLTGDALYANYIGTQYVAKLYILDGNVEWAIESWRSFKEYLEEYKTDYDEEELDPTLELIQNELESLLAPCRRPA